MMMNVKKKTGLGFILENNLVTNSYQMTKSSPVDFQHYFHLDLIHYRLILKALMIQHHNCFYDSRFADDRYQIFLLFNQRLRHKAAQNVFIKFKNDDKMISKLETLINSPSFD